MNTAPARRQLRAAKWGTRWDTRPTLTAGRERHLVDNVALGESQVGVLRHDVCVLLLMVFVRWRRGERGAVAMAGVRLFDFGSARLRMRGGARASLGEPDHETPSRASLNLAHSLLRRRSQQQQMHTVILQWQQVSAPHYLAPPCSSELNRASDAPAQPHRPTGRRDRAPSIEPGQRPRRRAGLRTPSHQPQSRSISSCSAATAFFFFFFLTTSGPALPSSAMRTFLVFLGGPLSAGGCGCGGGPSISSGRLARASSPSGAAIESAPTPLGSFLGSGLSGGGRGAGWEGRALRPFGGPSGSEGAPDAAPASAPGRAVGLATTSPISSCEARAGEGEG